MKIKLIRSYKKLNKLQVLVTVFVYAIVNATAEQLAKYKAVLADNFREDEDGQALWFSTRCVGQTGTLIITSANKVVADTSKFDEAASLAQQYGGNLGTELAKHAANMLLGAQVAPANVQSTDTADKADLNK